MQPSGRINDALSLVAVLALLDDEHVDEVPPAVSIRTAHGHLARALEAELPAPPAREIAAQWQAAGEVASFAQWAIPAAEEARRAGDLQAQVVLLDDLMTRWDEPGVARAAGVPWAAAALALVAALRLAGQPHRRGDNGAIAAGGSAGQWTPRTALPP